MAIIDVLKYDGPNNALVWKWRPKVDSKRDEELRLGTQLVVNQSQQALFIKGGQLLDIFEAGTHTLSTQNLPILSSLIGLAFGGQSPFKAEVYFINKAVAMDTKFGLIPFNMMEPNFRVPIPITSRGSFAIKVADAKIFLNQIIGTVPDFEADKLTQFFRGIITENVKTAITRISKEQNINPLELEAIVSEVSGAVKGIISEALAKYGLHLEFFNIEAIPVVDEDPRVKKIVDDFHRLMSQDMEERMRLKRRAENLEVYKVERTFDTTEKAAENIGGGSGVVRRVQQTILGHMQTTTTCPTCHGSGTMITAKCGTCKGEGREYGEETISIDIPAGVNEGIQLSMNGKGNAGERNGPSGDLIVQIEEIPHEELQRDGNDVLYNLYISFPEAVMGAQAEVPTIDGKARIKVDAGTQSGKILKLKGKGLPDINSRYEVGDQLVYVNVWTPKQLNSEEKALLEKLKNSENFKPNPNKKEKGFFSRMFSGE